LSNVVGSVVEVVLEAGDLLLSMNFLICSSNKKSDLLHALIQSRSTIFVAM
jgi:hypothetical protein